MDRTTKNAKGTEGDPAWAGRRYLYELYPLNRAAAGAPMFVLVVGTSGIINKKGGDPASEVGLAL